MITLIFDFFAKFTRHIVNIILEDRNYGGCKVVSPAFSKVFTTRATYIATDLMKYKVVPLKFNDFLHSTGGKVLLYGFVAYA